MRRAVLMFGLVCALAACGPAQEASAPAPTAEPPNAEDVRVLEDTNELVRITNAIDEAVDRKAWSEARQYFTDQVDVDFTSLGARAQRTTADQLVENWKTSLPEGKPSFHMRGGHIVRLEGDTGTVVSQGYAWNRLPLRAAGTDLWEVWGSYEHRFARTAQGWRVTGMKFVKTHERGDPAIRTALPPAKVVGPVQ